MKRLDETEQLIEFEFQCHSIQLPSEKIDKFKNMNKYKNSTPCCVAAASRRSHQLSRNMLTESISITLKHRWRNNWGHQGISPACSKLTLPGKCIFFVWLDFITKFRNLLIYKGKSCWTLFENLPDFWGPTVVQIRPPNTSSCPNMY